MRTWAAPLATALAGALLLAPTTGAAQSITFATADAGKAPKDFEPAPTGNGSAGRWEIVADSTAEGGKGWRRSAPTRPATGSRF